MRVIWEEEYFNAGQGVYDGDIAIKAAYNTGFPVNTTIYFAVDVDILDGDIDGTVIPYIALDAHGMYQVGIYGTRNVCQKAIDSGAVVNCFVSDMSTGFSGNLGFSMPKEWAFDQFYEHNQLGFPIYKVAVSGRDYGVGSFNNSLESLLTYHATQLLKQLKWDTFIKDVGFSLDKEYHAISTPQLDVYVKATASGKVVNNKAGYSILVSNGIVDKIKYSDPLQAELKKFDDLLKFKQNNQMEEIFNELAPTIGNGLIETGVCARDGKIGMKFIVKKEVEENVGGRKIKSTLELVGEIYTTPLAPSPIPAPRYKEIYDDIAEADNGINWGDALITIGSLTAVTIGVIAPIVFAPAEGIAALASSFLLLLSQL